MAASAMTGGPDLLLRPWAESDAVGLRAAIDEDVDHLKPWLSWTLEEPASLDRTRERLREHVEQFRTGRALRYAITPASRPSRILGGAHLKPGPGGEAHEIGYWTRSSATRQGIASAAVSALVVRAFADGARRVTIRCDAGNEASAAFARALGFVLADEVAAAYPDGRPRPLLAFELTRGMFEREHADGYRNRARRVRLA